MKTEYSRKSRSIVSGVAAFAITTALVSTLVEALNPALLVSGSGYTATQAQATVIARRDSTSYLEA